MSKQYDPSLQFQTIENAARTTGLSQYFLRSGCRNNSIPFIRIGNRKYLINVPMLLQQLNEQSTPTAKATN